MKLGRPIRIASAGCWLLGFAAAGLLATPARAQVETVPIHFSKPFEPILTTNLNALVGGEKGKSFQELLRETDGHGISGLFRDDLNFSPMPTPNRPRMSAAAAQKYREAADRKKNWVFTIEDDAQNDPKVSQLMRFLDEDAQAGTDTQRNIYQNFYDRLERENTRLPNANSADGSDPYQRDANLAGFDLANAAQGGALPGPVLPGGNGAGETLGGLAAGDNRNLPGSRTRDPLNLAAKRDSLSTTATRQAADFKSFEQGSSFEGLSTPSQRARLDAFKGLFDSKSSPTAAAVARANASSPLSSAMNSLGLPSPSFGASPAAASGKSFAERFDPAPAWKPSAPASSPLPSFSSPLPSTPSRIATPFPSVPTRRQ